MSVTDDREAALSIYEMIAAGGDEEEILITTISGPPASKSRPRFGKGGRVYSTAEMKAAEERTAWLLRKARGAERGPMTGNVALGCLFFRPNSQRIDTDNLLKHVCDAANGVLWVDDSQVTAVFGTIELDAENPRTVVVVGKHNSSLKRGTDSAYPCAVCGGPMIPSESSGKNRVSCSPACANVRRGYTPLIEPVPCAQCSKPFRRKTKTQRFCSRTCRGQSLVGENKSRARAHSRCLDCDVELAHARGGRCRDCWKAWMKRSKQERDAAG